MRISQQFRGRATVQLLFFICALHIKVQSAWAYEYGVSVGGGVEHSDNILLTTTDRTEEWINLAILGFNFDQSEPELDAKIEAVLQYQDYRNDTIADYTASDIRVNTLWRISPQHFQWELLDDFTQRVVDPRKPFSPSNRQDANVFTTGPDYIIRMNSTNNLEFGARAYDYYFESLDLDSSRYEGLAKWEYQTTPATRVSANYGYSQALYDNSTLNQNFSRTDYFLQIETKQLNNTFLADSGISSINGERSDPIAGPRWNVAWDRQISPQATTVVSGGAGYSDPGTAISNGTSNPNAGITGNQGSDIFYSRRLDGSYTNQGSSISFQLAGFWRVDTYEVLLLDEGRVGGTIDLGYFHSPSVSATLSSRYEEDNFLKIDRIDQIKSVAAEISYTAIRNLPITFSVKWVGLNSEGAVSIGDYEETRIKLSLVYTRGGRQRMVLK